MIPKNRRSTSPIDMLRNEYEVTPISLKVTTSEYASLITGNALSKHTCNELSKLTGTTSEFWSNLDEYYQQSRVNNE